MKIQPMVVQILMSTMNRRSISDLNLKTRNINDDILIINQTDNTDYFEDVNSNITMINMDEIGTSNSRNAAIKNAGGDICILADDDITYVENYKEIIETSFNRYPDADIITFQIECTDGTSFKDNYMKNPRLHNLRTVLKCSSIEIVFRRDSIIKNNLFLDYEFGLGSRYRIHDDVIFLADALKNKLKVRYLPIPIVLHPRESSGTMYNDFLVTSKGAAFARIYGIFGVPVSIMFALKKRKDYRNKYSMVAFTKLIISGWSEYLKTHK